MASESAGKNRPTYSSYSSSTTAFSEVTSYPEQRYESSNLVRNANLNQPTKSHSEATDPIELSDHQEQQSDFSHAVSNIPLDLGRQQLFPGIVARLGLQIIITNIGATILLVSAVTALSLLWFGGEENKHWRRVMIDGWIGQAVTLSTLAIRLAVSVHAGTAVAMLASVSLESKALGGVLLSEAPTISIARYVNTGPLESLQAFVRGFRWKLNILTFSIFVLAASALVSQFTSTLLLWDVRPNVVPGFPREIKSGIGFKMENYVGGFGTTVRRAQNYWLAPPPSYPTFAEWALRPYNLPESIMDTGPSIRAFLPIDSESDRSALLEFEGIASAFDARVTCVRPTIKDWSFQLDVTRSSVFLNGTLFPPNVNGDLADLLRQDIPPTGYSFSSLLNQMSVASDPTFMIHSLPRLAGGLLNSLNPMQNSTLDYSYRSFDDRKGWFAQNKENEKLWEVSLGHSFLLIGVSTRGGPRTYGNPLFDFLLTDGARGSVKVEERGPWIDLSQDTQFDDQKLRISVTTCYDALYHNYDYRVKGLQDFLVSAKRKSNHSEPKLGWDAVNKRFETVKIRAQLSTLQATSDGSAFVLDPTYLNQTLRSFRWDPKRYHYVVDGIRWIKWYYDNYKYHFNDTLDILTEGNAPSETYDFLADVVWEPLRLEANDIFEIFLPYRNYSAYQAYDEEGIVSTDTNLVLNTIFEDIMKETDNPALAWQALVTAVMRMAYYDWLPTFDYTGNATVTSMVPCQKPQHCTGFILVMANLFVHLVFVAVSSFLFFTRTRYSLLGNCWQAIAQIKAPGTGIYLDNATMLDDKKVKQEIDREGTRRRVNIRRNDEDDRVCLL